MSESKTKYDQEQNELEEAQKALWEKKMGKKPLHPNQQKLDVHEPEKDELTAKDFEMLRAGKKAKMKEDVVVEAKKGLHQMSDEELKTAHDDIMSKINTEVSKGKSVMKGHRLSGKLREVRFHQIIRKMNPDLGYKHVKEDIEQVNEKNKDTPGQHMCAVHVKNEQWGEGKTIYSMHAEPDVNGNIAWYDVMFEHGIEKEVPADKLEVLVSEAHKNHKKMAEDVEQAEIDEARGRPRKNPLPAGEDQGEEPDHNIVMHLKKSVDTDGSHDVKFGDGKSHKVPSHVAKNVLGAMGKLKPADRLEIQKHIGQSHSNLMQVHGMIK